MKKGLSLREGDPIPVVTKLITQEKVNSYARAAGDFNPIHIDPAFAATSHFGRTIAHGMLVVATVSEMMTAAFEKDWLEAGKLKIRFRAPVFPGDTITSSGLVKKVTAEDGMTRYSCTIEVRKQDGETAITGDASVAVSNKAGC